MTNKVKSPEVKALERRKKIGMIRRRRRLRLFVLLLFVVLLIVLGVILYRSDYFLIKKIEVEGAKRVPEERIVKLSGLTQKDSLLKFSAAKVKERILREPWVRRVEVYRFFPDRVKIKVFEREPLAAIYVEKKYVLIDESYLVLEHRKSLTERVPVIRDLKLNDFPVGKRVRSKTLVNAVKCLSSQSEDMRKSIESVIAPTSQISKLTLITRDGVEILYGKSEDIELKNKVIRELLAREKGKIIFIDVRVATNPIVKRLQR